jgi:hypothetical protein
VNHDPHAPNRLSSYMEIHETVLASFRDSGFVYENTLCFKHCGSKIVGRGEISCLGEIVIDVYKMLSICDLDRKLIQTSEYSYNVFVRSYGNIFRYDNLDPPWREGHHDCHHKHSFDWRTGIESPGSPLWIGREKWPTLGQVLQETKDWYWENFHTLPSANTFSPLGLRRRPPSLEL